MLTSDDLTKYSLSFVVFIAILALYTFLIQTIWNKVIIKKFPSQNIQTLSFWDALALAVFVSLLRLK